MGKNSAVPLYFQVIKNKSISESLLPLLEDNPLHLFYFYLLPIKTDSHWDESSGDELYLNLE